MSKTKTLLLVPHLKGIGGVSNYYNSLKLEAFDNVQYFTVNKPNPQPPISTFFRLISNYILFTIKVVKGRYALIHVNPSLDQNSFYRDAIFIVIARLLQRKVLIFFRGWLEEYEKEIKKSSFKTLLFKVSYAKANKFIVLGSIFKNKLLEMGVPSKTTFFLETTVADSRFVNELDMERKFSTYKNEVVFLFLSRILKTKGIYIALDAFQKFAKEYPGRKSRLIISGDGPELPKVKAYVKEQNIRFVEFTGHVSDEEKKNVLLKSHVMIFPSYTEGLPNSILEGMLYGMPIISRVTGAIPDVVQNGVNGFLSDSFDASVYATFIASLALNTQLYETIALENHKVAFQNYSTEQVRERILRIYKSFYALQ